MSDEDEQLALKPPAFNRLGSIGEAVVVEDDQSIRSGRSRGSRGSRASGSGRNKSKRDGLSSSRHSKHSSRHGLSSSRHSKKSSRDELTSPRHSSRSPRRPPRNNAAGLSVSMHNSVSQDSLSSFGSGRAKSVRIASNSSDSNLLMARHSGSGRAASSRNLNNQSFSSIGSGSRKSTRSSGGANNRSPARQRPAGGGGRGLGSRSASVAIGMGAGGRGRGLGARAQSVRLDRNAFAAPATPSRNPLMSASPHSAGRPGLIGSTSFGTPSSKRAKSSRRLAFSDDEDDKLHRRSTRRIAFDSSDDDDDALAMRRSRSSRRILSSDDEDENFGRSSGKSSRKLKTSFAEGTEGTPRKKTKRRMNREKGTRRRKSTRNLMGKPSRNDMSGRIATAPENIRVSNAGNFGLRLGKTLLFAPPGSENQFRDAIAAKAAIRKKKRKRKCPKLPWQKEEEEVDQSTTNTTQLTGASTVAGRKAIGLQVLRVAGDAEAIRSLQESTRTGGYVDLSQISKTPKMFAPRHLLEIERGASVLISNQSLIKHHNFQDLGEYGAVVVTMKAKDPLASADTTQKEEKPLKKLIKSQDIRDFDFESEVGRIERVWLTRLRRNIMANLDIVNGLRLSRQLQNYMPLQSASDAYLIAQIIAALEGKGGEEASFILDVAFKSRNISRIISQTASAIFDFKEHDYQLLRWIRLGDMSSRYILPGISQLPFTENLTPLRTYVPWIVTSLLSGKQEVIGSNEKYAIAQDMTAEIHGHEIINRNRYGTFIGRQKTIEFRSENRFPADDAVLRAFSTQPIQTMVDYGVVFTLRLLAQHWRNMVSADSNHFANDRLDQLDPFEAIRVYIPSVCIAISSFRGRSGWDSAVLAEFVKKCQYLKPAFTADKCRSLMNEMKHKIIPSLCAGIESISDPLNRWLDSISAACTLLENEARTIYQKITTVEIGLRLGYDLVTQVNFEIPSDEDLLMALLLHLRGKNPGKEVRERSLRDAISLMTPRDQRTLLELVKKNQIESKPAKFLLDRARALAKRILRREYFSEAIRHLSMGEETEDIFHDEWYWVFEGEKRGVYIFDEDSSTRDSDCFIHADSGVRRFFDLDDETVKFCTYIPIAEAISRAQRCYMNIELDHGKRFRFNAFMEFSFLRVALRQLAVVSLIFCEELDDARMTVLREVQLENQEAIEVRDMKLGNTYYVYNELTRTFDSFAYETQIRPGDPQWSRLTERKILKIAPQNMVLVGAGPSGFLTAIHCTESVLASGGMIKLYMESKAGRDAEYFESAEVVRLDQRWTAMLRYYLGTVFEDAFVPTSETNPMLGNNEPSEGFLEVATKDLENMLHIQVSKLWSKGLIQVFTDADARYDPETNAIMKDGQYLKVGDLLVRKLNGDGKKSDLSHSWKVTDVTKVTTLGIEDLKPNTEYAIYVALRDEVLPFKLTKVELQSRTYTFESLSDRSKDIVVQAHTLPAIYPKGTQRHMDVETFKIECLEPSSEGEYKSQVVPMKKVRNYKFTLDLHNTHVFQCVGKKEDSTTHLSTTTSEPYGLCCLQGAKVSFVMHNFGVTVRNKVTTVFGDNTKMVRQDAVVSQMVPLVRKKYWKYHFLHVLGGSLEALESLMEAIMRFAKKTKSFRRKTLQIRFVETCDNFSLGMEMTHVYRNWRAGIGQELAKSLKKPPAFDVIGMEPKDYIAQNIDKLWFQATLEVLTEAKAYAHSARRRVPHFYLAPSHSDDDVGELDVGDAFTLKEKPGERYEVVVKDDEFVFSRNANGHMTKMTLDRQVRRDSDLTRALDGVAESKIAVSVFTVGQFVNHRSARVNNEKDGYVYSFIGNEQATPHFMRADKLTGTAINAMLVNNFVRSAVENVPFVYRLEGYCVNTNTSNGQVVTSSIGSNHASDGFLRLGFSFKEGVDYLHAKVVESMDIGQNMEDVLSPDWKAKFAAPLVPRGMETNKEFIDRLRRTVHKLALEKFIVELKKDKLLATDTLMEVILRRKAQLDRKSKGYDYERYWDKFLNEIEDQLTEAEFEELEEYHCEVAKQVEHNVNAVVDFAKKESLYNERVRSEYFNQPKPVDAIINDGAMEAQLFPEAFITCAAIAALNLAFVLMPVERRGYNIFSACGLAVFNIILTGGIIVNAMRYKNKVEGLRIHFFHVKIKGIQRSVFALMDAKERSNLKLKNNPIASHLEEIVKKFRADVAYYGKPKPDEFMDAFEDFKKSINDPEAIQAFQRLLARHFIGDVYQDNAALRDSLVEMYLVCDDMHYKFTNGPAIKKGSSQAKALLKRLRLFSRRLEDSLQKGDIHLVILRLRRFVHWHAFSVVRAIYGLFCCSFAGSNIPLSPIQTETHGILKGALALSKQYQKEFMRREIVDLRNLHYATRESDMASMILCTACVIHYASWFMFGVRFLEFFIRVGDLTVDLAYFAFLLTAGWGLVISILPVLKKFYLLWGVWWNLGGKKRTRSKEKGPALRKLRRLTLFQIFLVYLRFCAGSASGIALVWNVALRVFPEEISSDLIVLSWISKREYGLFAAGGAIGLTLFVNFLSLISDFVLQFGLSPRTAQFICEGYRKQIEKTFKRMDIRKNDVESKLMQERRTWEYVAEEFCHKYRFDLVLSVDRFGAVYQYILSGMDPSAASPQLVISETAPSAAASGVEIAVARAS
ncbi:unnamed protein product [Cylindrotheca closterium]|uniref:Uncharacterized protein n=1 Tax=Cylindrotheca closterium TaxID=2856 RepID=A0AAD2CTT9_9STRA|nr:unnamed protein product [Cylindrotheca closterium]